MEKKDKLYYSISEVAQMFGLNEPTLRYWEKEFDIINPRRTAKGVRFYRQEDIEAVRQIYHLVKERGLTLAGARQKLRDNRDSVERQAELAARLKAVREELQNLSNAVGTPFRICGTPLQRRRNPIPHLRNATPTPSEPHSAFAERHSNAVGSPFRICGTPSILH